jgi:hypothetical protein
MHGWRLYAFPLYFAVHSLFVFLCVWGCEERWRRKMLHRTGEALQVALWSYIYSLFCICFQYTLLCSIYAAFDLVIDLIGEIIIYLAILAFERLPSRILLPLRRLHLHLLPHPSPSLLPPNRSRIL